MTRIIRQRAVAAVFAVFATVLTGALLIGLDPVLKPMLAPVRDNLLAFFAVALIGHVAIARWRALKTSSALRALPPANDDREDRQRRVEAA